MISDSKPTQNKEFSSKEKTSSTLYETFIMKFILKMEIIFLQISVSYLEKTKIFYFSNLHFMLLSYTRLKTSLILRNSWQYTNEFSLRSYLTNGTREI